jgi:hypothetical protein
MRSFVEMSLGAAGVPHDVVLKLQGEDGWQLNVWATFEELSKLRAVRTASWEQRRSIRAGTSAGCPVFWAAGADDPETATALIGHDDETWDIAFGVPVALVERIGALAADRRLD